MLKHIDISFGSCLNKLSCLIFVVSISESDLESCLEAVTIFPCLCLNVCVCVVVVVGVGGGLVCM